MLFLLNDKVIDIETPEARVLGRWRDMGCGDPRHLRAHEAVEFVKTKLTASAADRNPLDDDVLQDLAALVISKTGANSLILKPTAAGDHEVRLQDIAPLVLETYRRGAANDQDQRRRA